jgi:hypothetical protein
MTAERFKLLETKLPADVLDKIERDVADFRAKRVDEETDRYLRDAPGAAGQRRHRTGRNIQFNIKATRETIGRFIAISEREQWVFGETLARAIDALEQDEEGQARPVVELPSGMHQRLKSNAGRKA